MNITVQDPRARSSEVDARLGGKIGRESPSQNNELKHDGVNLTLSCFRPDLDLQVSTSGSAIRLRGVTKGFGDHQVLHGIDLDIRPGQFVAIVGRSGCGKSTLLRLLAGLDQPTSGTIEIDGAAQNWRDRVRLMFQEPRLLPWQRVAPNVEVGLSHSPAGPARRRQAIEALAQVGLAGRETVWPAILSGGQKQRVALARALVSHPDILAFDEPLGALDALTRIEMQALIEQVWQDKGFTAVVVTHDVSEAVALADRILLLDDGRVAMDVAVDLPRPRRRGDPQAAAIEGRILDQLLQR
jgi:sulfonate transport system ATP-binding protein